MLVIALEFDDQSLVYDTDDLVDYPGGYFSPALRGVDPNTGETHPFLKLTFKPGTKGAYLVPREGK